MIDSDAWDMTGSIILVCAWFASGAAGVILARRGSIRDYGEDIYFKRWWQAPVGVALGLAGLIGSIVAW